MQYSPRVKGLIPVRDFLLDLFWQNWQNDRFMENLG